MPRLVFSQGDPAGIGPEILARCLLDPGEALPGRVAPVVVAEKAALDSVRHVFPGLAWETLRPVTPDALGSAEGSVAWIDPFADRDPVRELTPGHPGPDDAFSALRCLEVAAGLAESGRVDALVTAPLHKAGIARHVDPTFTGHTDWLAARCGLDDYGRDFLMAFLAPELRVALLSTHLPLRQALDRVTPESILEALELLDRQGARRIGVAGFNPHAGEEGLLGDEDDLLVRPAVEAAQRRGIDARGPESADSIFARARRGELEWVLALYHDQGLIAVKTLAFGRATNWTLGLPYLRTSVDHGTAFDLAGRGRADPGPLRAVIRTTLGLLSAPDEDETRD